MDAVKFIEERRRMCKSFGTTCKGCPANVDDDRCKFSPYFSEYGAAEQIKLLEKWVSAHPLKTRQSVFLEKWTEAEIDKQGVLNICPKFISADCRIRYSNCANRVCSECRSEFWTKEVQDGR